MTIATIQAHQDKYYIYFLPKYINFAQHTKKNGVMNKVQTYYLAGNILSAEYLPARKNWLAHVLAGGDVNYNGLVKLGSDKLILPALYSSLKRNSLLSFIPPELAEYLENIFTLNSQRNTSVLEHVKWVNKLLKTNGIPVIFMKGTAHMLSGLYHDNGERMVYDIDLLVPENEMLNAAGLLIKEGFFSRKPFKNAALLSTMHYPILLHENFVAGIEIHSKPTQYKYEKRFLASEVWNKVEVAITDPEIMIMSHRQRIIHNFLHAQLMHNGHYHADISHRDLYDLLLLGRKENLAEVFEDYGHFTPKAFAYLQLMYRVFGLEEPVWMENKPKSRYLVKRHMIVLNMSQQTLRRYHLLIMLFQKYIILPLQMLISPKARNYVFTRLTDLGWYRRHFNAVLRRIRR